MKNSKYHYPFTKRTWCKGKKNKIATGLKYHTKTKRWIKKLRNVRAIILGTTRRQIFFFKCNL